MPEIWKLLEGQVVDGKFPLLQYLGGSEHSGVFLSEHKQGERVQRAAIKLAPAQGKSADLQLSRWRLGASLSHANLISLFEVGNCQVGDLPLVYVVMEYAEENLSQVLSDRALTLPEARAMLEPVLSALAFLHGKGYVHGSVSPANIMANGDQLKLSSDEICRKGDPIAHVGRLDEYDPPEYRRGVIPGVEAMAPAGDVWSLGMTLIKTLTQKLPDAHGGSQRELALTQPIPEPFKEIVHYCLVRHPLGRWTVADIAARLKGPLPVAPPRTSAPAPAPAPTSIPSPIPIPAPVSVAAAAPQPVQFRPLASPPQLEEPPELLEPPDQAPRRWPIYAASLVVGLALVVVSIMAGIKFLRPDVMTQPLSADAANPPAVATAGDARQISSSTASITQEVKPLGSQTSSALTKPTSPKEQGSALAAPKSLYEKPEASSPGASIADAKLTVPNSARGDIVQRVLPDVPQSAKDTIRGTVRVSIRVDVDRAGNVENADLADPGPSRYFGRLALEAARKWKFPVKLDGAGTLSTWTVQFDFTRDGITAVPTEETP